MGLNLNRGDRRSDVLGIQIGQDRGDAPLSFADREPDGPEPCARSIVRRATETEGDRSVLRIHRDDDLGTGKEAFETRMSCERNKVDVGIPSRYSQRARADGSGKRGHLKRRQR